MTIKLETFDLPAHWASYFINGDETGYDGDDLQAMREIERDMVSWYGQCHCLTVDGDGDDFRRYHDATNYGVLACNVATFTFDVTKR